VKRATRRKSTSPQSDNCAAPVEQAEDACQAIFGTTAAPMDFSAALGCLKYGETVTRTGWNGKGQYVYVNKGDDLINGTRPHFILHTAQGDRVPWVPSVSDLLASDWRVDEPSTLAEDWPAGLAGRGYVRTEQERTEQERAEKEQAWAANTTTRFKPPGFA